MIITIEIRLEEFPDMHPHIVTHSGRPSECFAWLQGFLGAGGIIIDSFKTMGVGL